MGDLFKASGNSGGEEGPWGRADGQPLPASCGDTTTPHDPLTRYTYTYERKTWPWKDNRDIQKMIEDLNAARVASRLEDDDPANDDLAPVRAYLEASFDVPRTLTYLAILNSSSPWDEFAQPLPLPGRRREMDVSPGTWTGSSARSTAGTASARCSSVNEAIPTLAAATGTV